jgi:hypothetical protein
VRNERFRTDRSGQVHPVRAVRKKNDEH